MSYSMIAQRPNGALDFAMPAKAAGAGMEAQTLSTPGDGLQITISGDLPRIARVSGSPGGSIRVNFNVGERLIRSDLARSLWLEFNQPVSAVAMQVSAKPAQSLPSSTDEFDFFAGIFAFDAAGAVNPVPMANNTLRATASIVPVDEGGPDAQVIGVASGGAAGEPIQRIALHLALNGRVFDAGAWQNLQLESLLINHISVVK
jgi:hypothetical protein